MRSVGETRACAHENLEDDTENVEEGNYYSCQFPTGVVTALTSVVMTGKAGVPLLLTGDTTGSVKAWRELDVRESASDLQRMFGSIHLGAPITSMESLKGFPVCAVGLSDSSIKFIHIGSIKPKKFPSCHLSPCFGDWYCFRYSLQYSLCIKKKSCFKNLVFHI